MSFARMAVVAAVAIFAAAPAQALLVETPGVFGQVANVDFDAMPAGPTTLAAIQGAFPSAGTTAIGFESSSGNSLNYNFETAGGRGLALADPARGLELLDAVGSAAGVPGVFFVDFDRDVTEFGIDIGDVANTDFTLETYRDGGLLESLTFALNNAGELNTFSSDMPFDGIRLIEEDEQFNWVAPSFVVSSDGSPSGAEAPLPAGAALFVSALAVFAALRRKA